MRADHHRVAISGSSTGTILSTRPVGVEYNITALGKTLRDPIDVLVDWASEHIGEIEVIRARFDEE